MTELSNGNATPWQVIRRTLGDWLELGLPIVLVVVSVVLGERFENARKTIAGVRTIAGDAAAASVTPDDLVAVWLGLALFGTSVAATVGLRASAAIRAHAPDPKATRGVAVIWGLAATWSAWNLLGPVALYRHDTPLVDTVRSLLHPAAALLLLVAVVASGAIGADLRQAWDRASAVRVQILLLGLLLAVVLVIPVTSEQAFDVFRAWPDEPLHAVIGVAGALLLGAALRESATTFLASPTDQRDDPPSAGEPAPIAQPEPRAAVITGWQWVVIGSLFVLAIACLTKGLVGFAMLAVVGVTWIATQASEPPEPRRPRYPVNARAGTLESRVERRVRSVLKRKWLTVPVALLPAIAGVVVFGWFWPLIALSALGVWSASRPLPAGPTGGEVSESDPAVVARLLASIPLLIVFLGLANAAVDSFLLIGPSADVDWMLAGMTFGSGLLLAALMGYCAQGSTPDLLTLVPWEWLVPVLVGVATFLSSVTMYAGWLLLALAVLLAFADEATDHGVPGAPDPPLRWVELRSSGLAALAVAVAVYWRPLVASGSLGMVGVTMIALAGGLVVLHIAAYVAARRAPRLPVALFLPARVPVVSLLVLWVALASFAGTSTLHQARTVPGRAPHVSLSRAVHSWLDARSADNPTQSTITMLLVGASGGGSKAAFWTDLVLDCAFGEEGPGSTATSPHECSPGTTTADRMKDLFLTSSVSGGSVGVYQYLSHSAEVVSGSSWVNETVGRDVLSPVVAWGLFHDVPAFLLGNLGMNPAECTSGAESSCRWNADRALVQEAAVAGNWDGITPPAEEHWATGAPRKMPHQSADAPIAVFNGALDESVGRLLMAPLDLAPAYDQTGACLDHRPVDVPGGLDARDVLNQGTQLPLVTAALLSARFPVVEPPGRVGTHSSAGSDEHGCTINPPLPAVRVRDGGYVENSGLLTIVNLLPAIRRSITDWQAKQTASSPTVRIVVLSIDDDSAVLCPDPKLKERRGGFGLATQAGPDYLTRLARDALSGGQFPLVTYLRISPPPNVGAHAATGWQLSSTARDRHLEAALRIRAGDGSTPPARQNLDVLRTFLDGGTTAPTC